MTDDRETWKLIKEFYSGKFGIAPELVEIAPVLDYLRLCASGSSNETIATFFNENPEWLADLFDAYFGFRGWSIDLKFSPLALYKQLGSPDKETFTNNVILKHGYLISHDLDRMYESASMVEKLERMFDEKWI